MLTVVSPVSRARATPAPAGTDAIGAAMGALTRARVLTHGMLATQLYGQLIEVRALALLASRSLERAATQPDRAFPDEYHASARQARRAARLLGQANIIMSRGGEPSRAQYAKAERLIKRAVFLIDNAWIGAYTGTHY